MEPNSEDPDPEPPESSSEIIQEVYDELRKLAQYKMNNERGPQTLSATSLVHEAYLRVSKNEVTGQWSNKRHFFGAAAEAMRRILIDRARSKKRVKHGGLLHRDEMFESQIMAPLRDEKLLAVDEALIELEAADPESAELVKLRYFAGMTWEEISGATGIPDRTLRRRWTYAKAWLKERLDRN